MMSVLDKHPELKDPKKVCTDITLFGLTTDELNEVKQYWFHRWNFETGKAHDKRAYQSVVSFIDTYYNTWNTSQVTNMANMFANCTSLSSTSLEGWTIGAET